MSSEGYGRRSGMVIEVVDDCDRGKHQLQPRYDRHKMGSCFEKVYVGEVCVRCGHMVPRMMTLQEKLAVGLVSNEEAKAWLDGELARTLKEAFPLVQDSDSGFVWETPNREAATETHGPGSLEAENSVRKSTEN